MDKFLAVVCALLVACVASTSLACDGVVVGGGFNQVSYGQAFVPQASFNVGYAQQFSAVQYVPQQQFVLQRSAAVYAAPSYVQQQAVVFKQAAPVVQKSVSLNVQRRGLFGGGRQRIVNRTVVR